MIEKRQLSQFNQIRHIDFQHFDTGQYADGVAGNGRKIFSDAVELLGRFLHQLNFIVDFIQIDLLSHDFTLS